MAALTTADLRYSRPKSGFRHVAQDDTKPPKGHGGGKPFRAYAGGGRAGDWRGPRRASALEAAQDYCDYVNGNGVVMTFKNTGSTKTQIAPLMLNRANHPSRFVATTQVATGKPKRKPRKNTKDRMGTVYLIGEKRNADQIKIGWSAASGFSRLRELQTGNPRLLVGIAEKPGTQTTEYRLHLAYETDNILNEWFTATPELLAEFDVTQQQYEIAVGAEMEIA